MNQILIADDDSYIGELLFTTLSNTGYQNVTAQDGEEVFKIAREEKSDLIWLDTIMQQMNGYECGKNKIKF